MAQANVQLGCLAKIMLTPVIFHSSTIFLPLLLHKHFQELWQEASFLTGLGAFGKIGPGRIGHYEALKLLGSFIHYLRLPAWEGKIKGNTELTTQFSMVGRSTSDISSLKIIYMQCTRKCGEKSVLQCHTLIEFILDPKLEKTQYFQLIW